MTEKDIPAVSVEDRDERSCLNLLIILGLEFKGHGSVWKVPGGQSRVTQRDLRSGLFFFSSRRVRDFTSIKTTKPVNRLRP
ncbi:Uncharacterized protein DAT39_021510 [Clarias magur]|uniref:Uncharacterized protein n=1 Tax=Clarias magur TaxID=1594786 RepID=A0A8J4U125_CLAMG|nr:Uncharacterized protein DAT39_021510 [Clarias magur]